MLIGFTDFEQKHQKACNMKAKNKMKSNLE